MTLHLTSNEPEHYYICEMVPGNDAHSQNLDLVDCLNCLTRVDKARKEASFRQIVGEWRNDPDGWSRRYNGTGAIIAQVGPTGTNAAVYGSRSHEHNYYESVGDKALLMQRCDAEMHRRGVVFQIPAAKKKQKCGDWKLSGGLWSRLKNDVDSPRAEAARIDTSGTGRFWKPSEEFAPPDQTKEFGIDIDGAKAWLDARIAEFYDVPDPVVSNVHTHNQPNSQGTITLTPPCVCLRMRTSDDLQSVALCGSLNNQFKKNGWGSTERYPCVIRHTDDLGLVTCSWCIGHVDHETAERKKKPPVHKRCADNAGQCDFNKYPDDQLTGYSDQVTCRNCIGVREALESGPSASLNAPAREPMIAVDDPNGDDVAE